jgi:tetratricopeptide (TPR) repeat protein
MATRSKEDLAKTVAHPLLGRKFSPMSGALRRRVQAEKPSAAKPSDTLGPPLSSRQQAATGRTGSSNALGSRAAGGSRRELAIEARVTKESVCTEMLQEGSPQSYIDFFYLSHAKFGEIAFKEEDYVMLKEKLMLGERSVLESSIVAGIQVYRELGSYFEGLKENPAACYFYRKCMELGQKHQMDEQVALACLGLGSCYFGMGDIPAATEHYELGVEISERRSLKPILKRIGKELIEVYRILSDNLEKQEQLEAALDYHKKCLRVSHITEDRLSEGTSCFRIGMICLQMDNPREALSYHKKYLDISRSADLKEEITEALTAIAITYQAMDEIPLAIQHLEELNDEANKNQNVAAQAGATLHLGLLYHKQEIHKKAVENLEKHFQYARVLKNKSLVDAARVNLGVAKAGLNIDSFNDLVTDRLQALLQWKSKRAGL